MSSASSTVRAAKRNRSDDEGTPQSGRPILFCDRGCPFAHRVLALCAHLRIDVDCREVRVGEVHAGLSEFSSTAQLPTWVEGDLVLSESRVLLEYLAERHGMEGAYADDLALRALQRQAMAIVDTYFVPRLFGRLPDADDARTREMLDTIAGAVEATTVAPSLLALHITPVLGAFRAWRPTQRLTARIDERAVLRQWLDDASELECLASTAVDASVVEADIARARALGAI